MTRASAIAIRGASSSAYESFAALTPTLPPATHTQSYAIGTREVLLVEPATPYDDEQREWLAWAEGLRSRGARIRGIFVTHHHADHVGGAGVLAKSLGAAVIAHELTAARMSDPVDEHVGEGDVIRLDGPTPIELRVMHTPGHAVGHLCLHDAESGVLVVGDMVASIGTILIEPREGDMQRYLLELDRLAKLDAKLALPAHGDPVETPSNLFRAYITHRLMREAKVERALTSEAKNFDALLPDAYADTPQAIWPIAKLSLEAHLAKLVKEGRAARDADGRYRKG